MNLTYEVVKSKKWEEIEEVNGIQTCDQGG